MTEPIAVQVTRYRCPSCGRTANSRSRTREHMSRCWYSPENRGCKTCIHFDRGSHAEPEVGYPGTEEGCLKGVDLSGRPACVRCGGNGSTCSMGGASECGDCGGDGAEVKAGPIVHCDLWQPSERYGED